ncbi:MAG TPA: F0F1 ATP synthase subunit gamma [Acidimicrobiales bacterium]|jgi:F-type H+-transporting ATPase subunit gamma|nr:F0F1 ATP synthase subunit gamma [Acidimicrobiales bacterium]
MAGGQERELRRRIRSVESTKKITRAMELIAASRIVKAQQAINAARPYVAKIREVVSHLADSPDTSNHPLFRDVESAENVAIVLITADRGLAGGYNANVIRTVERMVRDHQAAGRNVQIVAVGRKGESYFRYRNHSILFSLIGVSDRPSYNDARLVVGEVIPKFEAGEFDRIELVYTRFVSMGTQAVTTRQLVPLVPEESGEDGNAEHSTAVYEFEPEPAEILDRLLPSWLEAEILAALLESAASEHASRQRAMKAATDNADELIKDLRRVMNRARQDAITTEIMEIVGGAEALRQEKGGDDSGPSHDTYAPVAEPA